MRILDVEFAALRDVPAIFLSCVLASLAGFVLFSNRELKRLELLVRHIIHLFLILSIALIAAAYMGWILWSVPITVIRFGGLIMGIYIAVIIIVFFDVKKVTDKMNEKLKERNKG